MPRPDLYAERLAALRCEIKSAHNDRARLMVELNGETRTIMR
jgi:hypothetical protein